MIIRALDASGDWTFGRGISNYLKFIEAYKQDLKTRILEFVNDCFFNISAGVDWLNLLSSKDQTALNLAISTIIVNTQNTTEIVSVNIVYNSQTRQITITYSVNTTFTSQANPSGNISGTATFLLTQDGAIIVTNAGEGIIV